MYCGRRTSLAPPEKMSPEQEESENKLKEKIINSGKTCCIDESLLMSSKGRELAQYFRQRLGSRRFFYLHGIEDRLKAKLTNASEAHQAKLALNAFNQIRGEDAPLTRPEGEALMLTGDINLAEYLIKELKVNESNIFFLLRNGHLRCWGEERRDKIKITQNQLHELLNEKKCWIASSALASARLTRFTEAAQMLPAPVQSHVQVLDVSVQNAIARNPKLEHTIHKLTTICDKHLLGAALPAAKENTLLALAIYYAAKEQCLLTVWNDAEEALRVWRKVAEMEKGKERLTRVAFCQFSWYGRLEPLKDFTQKSGTETLLPGILQPESPNIAQISAPTCSSIAEYLKGAELEGVELAGFTRKLQIALFKASGRKNAPGPEDPLTQEQLDFLVNEAYPEDFNAKAPSEHLIRTEGARLGKLISRLSIEEIRQIINGHNATRELAIIFARRWGKADILQALLDDSKELSPYCFNNWFKRSQNAEHNMTLEDLLLNNIYYNLLIKVIEKSAYLTHCKDTIDKLQLLARSAVISDVRKKAKYILESAAKKGGIGAHRQ